MAYAIDFPDPEMAVEWTLTESGARREVVAYRPRFYVAATGDNGLARIQSALAGHPDVTDIATERHRPGWRHDPVPTLAVEATAPSAVRRLASTVAQVGRPGAYRCFNVDLSPEFRYCLETGTSPVPEREPTVLSIAAPPLTGEAGVDAVTVTDESSQQQRIDGDTAAIARGVEAAIETADPDVLRLSSGELVPRLCDAVDGSLRLGREPGYTQLAAPSSYESYGRVGHSPARYNVPGRVLVDASNAFFLKEANLDGLLGLVERSHKPLQEAAWASIGTVLTAMQIREADRRDVLVPWRAWRPEFFKSAATLEVADRGGFTFAPEPGVYETVHELDFSSLYPNIMCTRNISPETVCCDCHPDREDVPGLGYSICPDPGYLPDVLQPLIDDRDDIKRTLRAADGADEVDTAALQGEADAIKWILVACFGYQGFSNAKFGRIECHEAINAFAREILLDAKDTLERHGWRVVHGIVDSLWVTPIADREQTDLEAVAGEISEETQVRLEYEAAYDWLAFCPRRSDDAGALTRYFGKRRGEPVDDDASYKRRGLECRQHSTPAFVERAQLALIRAFARTRSPEAVCEQLREFVAVLEDGRVDPAELAITNRVSKPREAYSQSTRNVAAMERAAAVDLDIHPGQSVEYVVVDDEKSGRARVALAYEDPDRYDADFYRDQLLRAAESVLAPAGYRREAIERHLAERVDGTLAAFGG